MAIASRFIIVSLIILLVFLVGIVLLQIFLSRRESRWPGLVLPLLTFLSALLLPLNVMDTGSVSENILLAVVTLLAGNIPTLPLAIFLTCSNNINEDCRLASVAS
ncbi:hypothetical protein [uncultured Oscillibacter sp.]|uniref:hypothetical protein n=1 Tax=uncultured Oscillibacter sp. TaxID=876091 RepID=UPI002638E856|nr:hypothetical protein [uncultured Oscillibacter sp.]